MECEDEKMINVTKSIMPSFDDYCDEIKDLWETTWLTNNGIKLKKLKRLLEEKLDCNSISLFVNGHSALESLIASFNFEKGSEIITTPYTFISTTNAIIRNSLTPIFCDVDLSTFNIDASQIEQLITDKTVAILAVHVYGIPCKCDIIEQIAKKHSLKVIYDAAHAFGVRYLGKPVVNYGDGSMLSFHATKVFHTIEGGAVVSNNTLSDSFFEPFKDFGLNQNGEGGSLVGPNFKMNEFQAAMGICNLKIFDSEMKKRRIVYETYVSQLSSMKAIRYIIPDEKTDWNYAYFPIVLKCGDGIRDLLRDFLLSNGYDARKYFYPCTNEFESVKYFFSETPNASYLSKNVLCLPFYSSLEINEVVSICNLIKSFLEKYGDKC